MVHRLAAILLAAALAGASVARAQEELFTPEPYPIHLLGRRIADGSVARAARLELIQQLLDHARDGGDLGEVQFALRQAIHVEDPIVHRALRAALVRAWVLSLRQSRWLPTRAQIERHVPGHRVQECELGEVERDRITIVCRVDDDRSVVLVASARGIAPPGA